MKKTFRIIITAAVLVAALALSAFAANFEHCADALNEIGLFKGTQNGYELDRAPTRAEAATMLVRLLGAEKEALSLEYTAPYTDVADWAKPYVQYLQDKGLTKGTSETTFGYSDKCTAQQYATFLLRALGYSDNDGGDFTYTEAMSFAESIGVVDFVNCNENAFVRDHVAAMSYTALSVSPKSGEADLLTKLKDSGAVSDDKEYIEFFENYRKYIEASESVDNAEKLSSDLKMKMVYSVDGKETMNMDYALNIAAIVNTENFDESEMAYSGKVSAVMDIGEGGKTTLEMPMSYYFADGVLYVDVSGQKRKAELSYEDAMETMGIDSAISQNPISIFKKLNVVKTADGTENYTMECAPGGINEILEVIDAEEAAAEYSSLAMTVKLRSGKLVSMSGDMEMNVVQGDGQTADVSVTYEMTNIKTGEDVKITAPSDLADYE